MNVVQRLVLIVGSIGIVHSSMVPPVEQSEVEDICRYAEFTARARPFTQHYGVSRADVAGLLAEWGMIAGTTGVLYLICGLGGRRRRMPPPSSPLAGPPPAISRAG